ncbi:CPXCG motif-containing cysteine-rich protein [Hydrogenimonas sp.]|uniref:CPXCG motif-containing cysteine-rich protein n=1 Tax=Hydrogenimonas sp. TaxID=2231112 RepID=UPI0034568CD0
MANDSACLWCWQRISILADGGLQRSEEIEDCEVRCNPIGFDVRIEEGRGVTFTAVKAQ